MSQEQELPPLDVTKTEGYGRCLASLAGAICSLPEGHNGSHYDLNVEPQYWIGNGAVPYVAELTVAQKLSQREDQLREALAQLAERTRERDEAQGQLRLVDETLARRPALMPCKTRYEAISKACNMAGRAEQAEAELAAAKAGPRQISR